MMKPTFVRRQAYDILEAVLAGHITSSVALERLETRERRDHALATELVLGVLRRLSALDFVAERVAGRPVAVIDPALHNVLRIGLYQLRYLDRIPEHAAVDQSVKLARDVGGENTAGFVNGVLRGYLRDRDALVLPRREQGLMAYLTVTESMPTWLVERWLARFGEDAVVSLVEMLNRPPGITLRVNTTRTTPADLHRRLCDENHDAQMSDLLPEAICVASGAVARSAVLSDGLAFVQDEAAQLVSALVGARSGERIYDACAAPGGKSLGLALAVGSAGFVVAADLRPRRVRRLMANAACLGLERIRALACDARHPGLSGSFDRVLVDAPCSGTGTLRKNPEIRWRLTAERLAELTRAEREVLDGSAPYVRPGGRLVYATCSIEPEENEAVVAAFLADHPEFTRADARADLPEPCRALVDAEGVLRTWPARVDLDGFTAVVMARNG